VSTDTAVPEALDLLTVGRVGVDIYPQQDGPLKDVLTFAKEISCHSSSAIPVQAWTAR